MSPLVLEVVNSWGPAIALLLGLGGATHRITRAYSVVEAEIKAERDANQAQDERIAAQEKRADDHSTEIERVEAAVAMLATLPEGFRSLKARFAEVERRDREAHDRVEDKIGNLTERVETSLHGLTERVESTLALWQERCAKCLAKLERDGRQGPAPSR